jgi:predicted peptidase
MFLHGAGERGTDIELVKKHGIPRLVASGVDFPFLVASPQCPAGQTWSPAMVGRVLDDVCRKVRVDRDRIYLTGLSMGGYGTWFTAIAYPDRFAAIVPICGGGDPGAACRLRDLPVWVFHGAKDPVVQPEESARMVEALRGCGGNVRFTLYPEAEHDCWTQTYQNPELYRWLLQQTRPAQM